MIVRMTPRKRIVVNGNKTTVDVKDATIEYFAPDLNTDVLKHLSTEGSLDVLDTDEAKEYSEATGLPVYKDEFTNWLLDAVNAKARAKASGAFSVLGDTEATLKVDITGTLPASLEDLLATERSGGQYQAQKTEFLAAFTTWAEENVPKFERYVAALGRTSIKATPVKAWPKILETLEQYVTDTDGEADLDFPIYLRSIRKQLAAPAETEDWDDLPDLGA